MLTRCSWSQLHIVTDTITIVIIIIIIIIIIIMTSGLETERAYSYFGAS